MDYNLKAYDSPIGRLLLGASEKGLSVCDWEDSKLHERIMLRIKRNGIALVDDSPFLDIACRELDEYFNGNRREFDFPLDPAGTTFQRRVWHCLRGISRGERWSYGDLASRMGHSRGVRAVASAIGNNPLSIIVPCHRVIGKDGSLTGYAGGLSRKEFLLNFETES